MAAAGPSSGTHRVALSPAFLQSLEHDGPQEGDGLVAFKYKFKPSSITSASQGVLYPPGEMSSDRGLAMQHANSDEQSAFRVREERTKKHDCVLIWDEEAETFTLHPLTSTLNLTLDRNLVAPAIPKKRRNLPKPTEEDVDMEPVESEDAERHRQGKLQEESEIREHVASEAQAAEDDQQVLHDHLQEEFDIQEHIKDKTKERAELENGEDDLERQLNDQLQEEFKIKEHIASQAQSSGEAAELQRQKGDEAQAEFEIQEHLADKARAAASAASVPVPKAKAMTPSPPTVPAPARTATPSRTSASPVRPVSPVASLAASTSSSKRPTTPEVSVFQPRKKKRVSAAVAPATTASNGKQPSARELASKAWGKTAVQVKADAQANVAPEPEEEEDEDDLDDFAAMMEQSLAQPTLAKPASRGKGTRGTRGARGGRGRGGKARAAPLSSAVIEDDLIEVVPVPEPVQPTSAKSLTAMMGLPEDDDDSSDESSDDD